ncbi:hypothetical protein FA13DRAFT_1834776 [Coprinellus micaceus]|uniref:Uncharacterized protein n=1 Tax=Coprinellus micaceus TaxID=71717 RepID=A0A4Y7SH60_COPMI|nr:hypothetical protein FA13DRAFT_1834776 [Coprinellus micaceus]
MNARCDADSACTWILGGVVPKVQKNRKFCTRQSFRFLFSRFLLHPHARKSPDLVEWWRRTRRLDGQDLAIGSFCRKGGVASVCHRRFTLGCERNAGTEGWLTVQTGEYSVNHSVIVKECKDVEGRGLGVLGSPNTGKPERWLDSEAASRLPCVPTMSSNVTMSLDSPFSDKLRKNYIAQPGEEAGIRTVIEDQRTVIRELDVELEDIDQAITALTSRKTLMIDRRDTHQQFIDDHRSLLFGVLHLPEDILSKIFMESVPPHGQWPRIHPIIQITHVCRQWRDSAWVN